MINDSDEEVLYGSDTEELLNMPISQNQTNQNLIPNLIDTRTDEESDWNIFFPLLPLW